MHPDPQLLVHLCSVAQWKEAQVAGRVEPESLSSVGFVHLSSPEQVHLPANRIFAGRTDTVLLFIDRRRLTAPLRWEPGVPGDPDEMRFPHLYGPLPVESVVRVARYLPLPGCGYPPLALGDSSPVGAPSTTGLVEYREP